VFELRIDNGVRELHRRAELCLQFSRKGQRCQLRVQVSAPIAGYKNHLNKQ